VLVEAEYARELSKEIVPLRFEDRFKPRGWLGMLCGGKLYVKFRDSLAQFDDNMRELSKQLKNALDRDRNKQGITCDMDDEWWSMLLSDISDTDLLVHRKA